MRCPHCNGTIPTDALGTDPMAKSRRRDPATSKAAAVSAAPRAGSQRARLLEALGDAETYGFTVEQLALATRIAYVSASTRATELARGGFIADSGRTRKTTSHTDAIVWVITDAGREALAGTAVAA